MMRMIGKGLLFVVLIMCAVAIWKANNGDINSITQSIWDFLNKGADAVTNLWNSIVTISEPTQTAPPA